MKTVTYRSPSKIFIFYYHVQLGSIQYIIRSKTLSRRHSGAAEQGSNLPRDIDGGTLA